MDENKRILDGLMKAMQAEVDGHNFYKMAANSADDEKGKEVFMALAQDEVEHYMFLKAQYDSYLKNGKADMTAVLGNPSADAEGSIFSDSFRSRIKEAHLEMTALSIGVQLEESAIKFYRAEAEAVSDPAVKEFYNELAAWEENHHRRLLKQQQELTEDYWHAGGFYPF
ncbi:MAG: ferritin family protein [candidate division Zixibacteria bacterium]|nr:ferritin family protein [candidate division Zixibacteria bacterium]